MPGFSETKRAQLPYPARFYQGPSRAVLIPRCSKPRLIIPDFPDGNVVCLKQFDAPPGAGDGPTEDNTAFSDLSGINPNGPYDHKSLKTGFSRVAMRRPCHKIFQRNDNRTLDCFLSTRCRFPAGIPPKSGLTRIIFSPVMRISAFCLIHHELISAPKVRSRSRRYA
jgi:hypothetical protein